MKNPTEEFLEKKLKWKAQRMNFPKKHSMLFEDLPSKKKGQFLALLSHEDMGNPVLFFKGMKNHWTIFGSKKVVSGTHLQFESFEYDQIVQFDVKENKWEQRFPKLSSFWMYLYTQLLVELRNGKVIAIHGHRSIEFSDIFGVLIMMDRLVNRTG